MKKFLLSIALLVAVSAYSTPRQVQMVIDPTHTGEGTHPRTPVAVPVFYIDGHTLMAGSYSVGSTVEIKDGDDVLFSTYIYIEGGITLPADLAGTYTIEVTRGDQRFIGGIEL